MLKPFFKDLSFFQHVRIIWSKNLCALEERIILSRKALFSLNAKAGRLHLPPDIHIDLFHKMVLPILIYGCEVWGYTNLEKLEIFSENF